jgi:hypothetical protein
LRSLERKLKQKIITNIKYRKIEGGLSSIHDEKMDTFRIILKDNDKKLQKENKEYKWDEYTRYNG